MSRRDALAAMLGGALSLRADKALAQEVPLKIAEMQRENTASIATSLEANPNVLARLKKKKFWRIRGEGDVSDLSKTLLSEGEFIVPLEADIQDFKQRIAKSPKAAEFKNFFSNIPEGEYRLLVDGDYQREKPIKLQITYLVYNNNGKKEFVVGVPTSSSLEEWSDAPDSKGTPTGARKVSGKRRGVYSQIISKNIHHIDTLPPPLQVTFDGKHFETGYFPNFLFGGDKYAFITTAVLWIDESRGVGMHGSNKVAGLGFPASDGCLRIPNFWIWAFYNLTQVGAPIFIHGTPLSPKERDLRARVKSMDFK